MKRVLVSGIILLAVAATFPLARGQENAAAKHPPASASTGPSFDAKSPGSAEDYYKAGLSYMESKQYKEAVNALKHSIRLNPKEAQTHFELGMAYFSLNLYKEAADSYKQALRFKPDWAEAHFRLGWMYYVLGRNQAAREQYEALKGLDAKLTETLSRILNEPFEKDDNKVLAPSSQPATPNSNANADTVQPKGKAGAEVSSAAPIVPDKPPPASTGKENGPPNGSDAKNKVAQKAEGDPAGPANGVSPTPATTAGPSSPAATTATTSPAATTTTTSPAAATATTSPAAITATTSPAATTATTSPAATTATTSKRDPIKPDSASPKSGPGPKTDSPADKTDSVSKREPSSEGAKKNASPKAEASTKAEDVPPTGLYRVGVGDVLDIRLLNSASNRSTLYTVMEGGIIEYPLVGGPLPVGGLTPSEIEARVAAELKRRSVNESAQVLVSVRDYVSHSVIVSGLVNNPGIRILHREALPLYVLLAEAQPRPDAGRALIMRSGDQIAIDLTDPSAISALVYPGDVITVLARLPQFYYIGGKVYTPGQKSFQPGITLIQAILAAGGLLRSGENIVTISREGADGRLTTTKFALKEIRSGKVPDPRVNSGDRIVVGP
jgi:protein involved in polysaccharide export with SLBB domain